MVLFFIFKLSNPESTCVTLGFEFASKPVYIAYLFAEWASIDYVADILYIEASWWSGEHNSYCKGNFGIKILYKQPFVNLFEVSRLLTPYNGRRRTVKPLKFLYINLVVLFFFDFTFHVLHNSFLPAKVLLFAQVHFSAQSHVVDAFSRPCSYH